MMTAASGAEACLEGLHGGDALLGVQAHHALQQVQGPWGHLLPRKLGLQEPPEASPLRRLLLDGVEAARTTCACQDSAQSRNCCLLMVLQFTSAPSQSTHGASPAHGIYM